MSYRTFSIPAIVAASVALLAGSYAIAQAASDGESNRARPAAQSFELLSRAPAPAAFRQEANRIAAGIPTPASPDDVKLARASAGHRLYAVGTPSSETVCLASREDSGAGSTACAPASLGADGERPLVSVDYLGQRSRVSALFPDGTSDVQLLHDGLSSPLPVENNTVTALVAAPQSLRWTAPDGSTNEATLSSGG